MITVGSKVRVKDNYTGNLDEVIGKVATVIGVQRDKDPAVESTYLLDLKGSYKEESTYRPGSFYTYSSNVIAFSGELEEFSYGMKDCHGQLLEIGDKVVYSGNNPGIIEGEVVDFKDYEIQRWGEGRAVFKVQLKIAKTVYHNDGNGRRFETEEFYTQWFEYGQRMMIVQKNLKNLILAGQNHLFVLDSGNE